MRIHRTFVLFAALACLAATSLAALPAVPSTHPVAGSLVVGTYPGEVVPAPRVARESSLELLPVAGEWVTYRITYSITMPPSEAPLRAWMPAPARWSTQRNVSLLGIQPAPVGVATESQGNPIIHWDVAGSPASTTFSEEFEFSALKAKWDIDPDIVREYDGGDPDLNRYLLPEPVIQSDDPTLRTLSARLTDGVSNPYEKVRRIFDFVLGHLNEYAYGVNDAVEAYERGGAECGGYSYLFIALLRAAGVPARPVSGIIALSEGEHRWRSGDLYAHVWAEVYLAPYGWVPADLLDTDINGGDSLGLFYGDRLVLSKGSDIALGHGSDRKVPWFHRPYVNDVQEVGEDLVVTVEIVGD